MPLTSRSCGGPRRLHPLATGFAEAAEAYERGRPDYPPEVVGAITSGLSIASRAPVLDLGAGTGKLTRALVHAGLDATAVEPQAPMRAILASTVGEDRVRSGTAEAIPLEDSSVCAVTAADAFHWFDHALALAEIRRVLRPRGGLAVITSVPDLTGASWAHEVGNLVVSSRPHHPHHDGPPWQEAIRAAGGWSVPRETRISSRRPARVELLLDWIASFSWIAAMAPEQRADIIERAGALIRSGHAPGELPVHFTIGLVRLL